MRQQVTGQCSMCRLRLRATGLNRLLVCIVCDAKPSDVVVPEGWRG